MGAAERNADPRSADQAASDEDINATVNGLLDRIVALYDDDPEMSPADRLLSAMATAQARVSGVAGGRMFAMLPADQLVDMVIEIAAETARDAGDTLRGLDQHNRVRALNDCWRAMAEAALGGVR